MKTPYLTILFLAIPFFVFSQRDVVICGTIKDTGDNYIVVSYVEQLDVNSHRIDTFRNNEGFFKVQFHLDYPNQVYFRYGNESALMFLKPGDSLYLDVDMQQFDQTLTYKGIGANENNFLADMTRTLPHSIEGATYMWLKYGVSRYLEVTDSFYNAKLTYLKSQEDKVSREFFRLYKYDILYNRAYRKITDPGTYIYFIKENEPVEMAKLDEQLSIHHYYEFLDSIRINNDSALLMFSYKAFTTNYINQVYKNLKKQAGTPLQYNNSELYDLAKMMFTGKALQYVLTDIVRNTLISGSQAEADEVFEKYETEVGFTKMTDYLRGMYETKRKFLAPGSPAPEFSLKDIHGKTISLHDFRGKIVYIDFWASWCGPCIIELNASKKIHDQYKKNKNLIFLYISLDEDESSWKNMVNNKKIEGVHLHSSGLESEVAKRYNIEAIPSFFIVDKEGKIFVDLPPRPSDKTLPDLLNAALKK